MKKTLLIAAAMLFAVGAFVGCSPSPDTISESTILKQFNQRTAQDATLERYAPITVGTYDCPDGHQRLILRQLEAAKLITYDVERYAWWERSIENVRESYRVQRYNWFYSYYDTEYRTVKKEKFDFEDHYVVTVALTSKGKKIAVEDLPVGTIEEDEDLINPDIDPSKYAWNKVDLTEEWPYIANPFLKPEKEQAEPQELEEQKEAKEQEEEKPAKTEKAKVDRIDSLQYEKFIQLDFDYASGWLKAGEEEGIKARNIQIYEVDGIRKARAEVIVATKNTTDVGRIFYGIEDDQRQLATVEFEFYMDKGWVLKSYKLDSDSFDEDDDKDEDDDDE